MDRDPLSEFEGKVHSVEEKLSSRLAELPQLGLSR